MKNQKTKRLHIKTFHFDLIVAYKTNIDVPCDYTEDKLRQRYLKGDGCMTIVTESNYDHCLRINIKDEEPRQINDRADMVVDCGILHIESDLFLTSSIGLMSKYFKVNPGAYAARVSFFDLDKVDRETEKGEDSYQLDLWIASEWPERILKQWTQKT